MTFLNTLDKILYLLTTQNKTQKEIADYIGVQKGVFTKWKNGENNSYLKHISKIAEYLGVSADYLLGTEQKEKSLSEKDKLIEKITIVLKNADLETLKAFLKLAENMKK